jgi:uncharacterized repeat protein (TIGR01451 family)
MRDISNLRDNAALDGKRHLIPAKAVLVIIWSALLLAPVQSTAQQCPAGTKPYPIQGAVNNGDFARPITSTFATPVDGTAPGQQLTQIGQTYTFQGGGSFISQAGLQTTNYNEYPAEQRFGLQRGAYSGPYQNFVKQDPFPGDPANNVPPSSTWFYSNGNWHGTNDLASAMQNDFRTNGEYLLWEQDIVLTNYSPTKIYVYSAYVSNVLEYSNSVFENNADPIVRLRLGGTTGLPDGNLLAGPVLLAEDSASINATTIPDPVATAAAVPTANSDSLSGWVRISGSFTGIPNPKLKFTSSGIKPYGDDFGLTAMAVSECTTPPDMQLAFSNVPPVISPGQAITGLKLQCVNRGGADALNATCNPTVDVGTITNLQCTPDGAVLTSSSAITCTFDYTAPGTKGGLDEPTTAINFTGATAATNNITAGNKTVTAQASVIDAKDDAITQPSSAIGQTFNLASNDEFPIGSVFSFVSGGTCANAQVSSTGIATYNTPASGSCSVKYQVCAPGAAGTPPEPCDTATLTVTTVGSDMAANFSGLPTLVSPGQQLTGLKLTCTNIATVSAANASCVPSVSAGTISNLVCSLPNGSTVPAVNGKIDCSFNYIAPGIKGGDDEPTTQITFTGTTGADNDSVPSNNVTAANAGVIDAKDDVVSQPGGATGQTYNVATNDEFPAGSIFSLVSGGSCPNASVSNAGVATYDIPSSGFCTVKYQVCIATATGTPLEPCDLATLTIASQPSDMTPRISGLPAVAAPGSTVSGVLTCTNVGANPAVNASCSPPSTATGVSCTAAGVPVTLPIASLPANSSIVCNFSVVTPQTGKLNLTATTGAANDINGGASAAGNNVAQTTVPVIDAVDDATVNIPLAGGVVTLLANDTLGGVPVIPAQVTISVVSLGGLPATTTVDPQGQLVIPANVTPNSYTVNYKICANPATTPPACDTAQVIIVVAAQPDLIVRKTHAPATLTEGNRGTYTITASNRGSAPTVGKYTVTDTLPPGMSVAAIPQSTGWDCSATIVNSGSVICTSTDIIPSASTSSVDNPNPISLLVNISKGACISPTSAGQCSLTNTVTISGGGEPNLPAFTSNNSFADPTPVQQAGAISGSAWRDDNHDRIRGANESGAAGVLVEVLDQTGAIVATATTAASGDYRVDGIVPGGGYSVRFKDPITGSYLGRPVSKDAAGGNDPSAQPGSGVVSSAVIQNLTVPSGNNVRSNQSLPLDPSGVLYDSQSRQPIGGVRVELLDATGKLIPAYCVVGGVNSITTSTTGAVPGGYSFWLANPVPSSCPGDAEYQLKVTPPTGYSLSTSIPPQAGVLQSPVGCTNAGAGSICTVQSQTTAPTGNQATPYYLRVKVNPATGPDVVNNHIPLDPAVAIQLGLVKVVDKTVAELGDIVSYTLRLKNLSNRLAGQLSIDDYLPRGFRYVLGTAKLANPNGSALQVLNNPVGNVGPRLQFIVPGTLAANAELLVTYKVRLGVGAAQGTGINEAIAKSGTSLSNRAKARVRVTAGVFTTEACVVGKVFVDCNGNQVQDAQELGIPNVRLYMQDGTSFITDSEGKYSFCGISPRSTVLKLDSLTLPRGSRLITSSNRNLGDAGSVFIDAKAGEQVRADFIEGSCSNTVLEQVKARRTQGEVRDAASEKRGQPGFKFEGKSAAYPQQGTDSANQILVNPRPKTAGDKSDNDNDQPVPTMPSASNNTRGLNSREKQ